MLVYRDYPGGLLISDSKIHGANMGPTWVLSGPGGSHVSPMNLAISKLHGSYVYDNIQHKVLSKSDTFIEMYMLEVIVVSALEWGF